MSWAVWISESSKLRHVMPVDPADDDAPKPPHIPQLNCPCNPAITDDRIVVHEEIN